MSISYSSAVVNLLEYLHEWTQRQAEEVTYKWPWDDPKEPLDTNINIIPTINTVGEEIITNRNKQQIQRYRSNGVMQVDIYFARTRENWTIAIDYIGRLRNTFRRARLPNGNIWIKDAVIIEADNNNETGYLLWSVMVNWQYEENVDPPES